MSFAAPEPILSDKISTVCTKCGKSVISPTSLSWDFGVCPSCYEYIPIQNNIDSGNPLSTVVKTAKINPVTIYLDKYTPFEMEKMK